MHAIILAIGDELVLGQTVDTNSAHLSAELAARGVGTLYHQTVADDRPAIADAITHASTRAPLLVISGGLGPTDDDLTRQALSDALGRPLMRDAAAVEAIRRFFEQRGREMPIRNETQAMHPEGTTVIPNTCGTAPGIRATLNDAEIFVTPGVPREMQVMFEQVVLPWVEERLVAAGDGGNARRVILTEKINTFGLGESDVADLLGELMGRDRNPKVGTTVAGGIVSVRVRSEGDDRAAARQALEATVAEVEAKLGAVVFGRGLQTLQHALVSLLIERGLTLTTAESCTGGLIGSYLTDVAGSSAAYLGGWVTYSNAMKSAQLGVPAELLVEHGAVSEPVARAMAEGALENAGADLAVGVTGIAGPGGGTADKPVGTVWIGLAHRDGGSITTEALRFNMFGERDMIRDRSAKAALQLLRLHVLGEPFDAIRFGRAKATV